MEYTLRTWSIFLSCVTHAGVVVVGTDEALAELKVHLAKVEESIAKTGVDIAEVERSLKAAQWVDDEKKQERLWKEKEHLWKKEEQLREEKRLLLEMLLLEKERRLRGGAFSPPKASPWKRVGRDGATTERERELTESHKRGMREGEPRHPTICICMSVQGHV